MAVLLVVMNAASIAVSGVLGGVAARRLPLAVVLCVAGASSAALAAAFAMAVAGSASISGLSIGFLAGLSGGVGLSLAYRAYAIGPVGVAASTTACTSTAVLVLVGLASGETLTPFRVTGVVLCIAAIVLVNRRSSDSNEGSSRAVLVLAVLAAFGFSGFVLLIDHAPAADGLWPVFAARVGVTVVGVLVLLALTLRRRPPGAPWKLTHPFVWIPVFAGLTDTAANLFLVFALQTADLILIAILAPVAPILTALIGRVVLHEVLNRVQILGLALGAGAVVFAAL